MCSLHSLCLSSRSSDGAWPALVLSGVNILHRALRLVALNLHCVAALVISSFICECSDQLIILIRMKTKWFVIWCIWVPEKNHVCLFFLLCHVTRTREALSPCLLQFQIPICPCPKCNMTKETSAQHLPRLSEQETLRAESGKQWEIGYWAPVLVTARFLAIPRLHFL